MRHIIKTTMAGRTVWRLAINGRRAAAVVRQTGGHWSVDIGGTLAARTLKQLDERIDKLEKAK